MNEPSSDVTRTPEKLVIDPLMIQTLRDESPGLLWRLIPLFIGLAEKSLAGMQAALKAGDGTALAHGAHAIKGSAANFGAERLMSACAALESAGHANQIEVFEELLTGVRREIQCVIEALKAS